MEQTFNKTTKSDTQAVSASLSEKTIQNKAKALQDNRPASILQRKANNTGLPNQLKSGIENLSGHSMDDVKVHYNSDKPAQLQAHAYAQGTDIHIASGQEKHLPHEAWHVVQQKQGRVKPTLQMKGKVNVNDDKGLEKEADVMGAKALQFYGKSQTLKNATSNDIIQRMTINPENGFDKKLGDNKKTIEKLKKLIKVMRTALSNDFPNDEITIEITNTGEITPAWNHHKGTVHYPGKAGNIGVQLNKWYLEKVSIGDLVGMFIHEIGVHTFADKKMGYDANGRTNGNRDASLEVADVKNDHNVSYNNKIRKIEKYPNAIESKLKKGRSRQIDHVNLAKSLAGGKSTRSDHYVNLYLATGDSLDKNLDGKEKDQALKDLTRSFLFDLGRLAATDDGGAASLFWNTQNIGELMNYYYKTILKRYETNHKWLIKASHNIKTGRWELRGYLLQQLGKLAVSSNPAVQVARSGVAGLLAGGIVLAAGATLATAALPALLAGAAVGGAVHYLQNRLGV